MSKRCVIAGLGVMGGHHLRVLRSLDGVEVVGAVDPDEERRAAAEAAHPGVRTFVSLAEALGSSPPDFCCLSAPVPHLPALATEAIEAGCDVLVEKPMAARAEEAEAMVVLAAERGRLLAVGLVERCNPAVAALKRRLDEGAIGDVLQLTARRLSPFPDRDSMLGVALDLSTHDIDVMHHLVGAPAIRVYAETVQHQHERAEDGVCATLRFASGATGLLETNWLTPAKVRTLSVTGSKGMLAVDYITQDLTFYEHPVETTSWDALAGMRGPGEGDQVRYALARREPLRVQWEAFVAGTPVATGEDGLRALSVALAIQRSGSAGEAVVPAHAG